jgi:hypothetical protein
MPVEKTSRGTKMDRKTFFILCVLCLPALLHPAASLTQVKCLCLSYAFIVAGDESPDRILDITKQPVIHSGDRLRILIVREAGYSDLYLFRLDRYGNLTILLPGPGTGDKRIVLPQDGKWYKLEESTGIDTFYFLATYYHLDALEKAVRAYSDEPQSVVAKAAVSEAIEQARRSYKEYASEEPGDPIAGTIGVATKVSVGVFYAKAIQLKHE